MARPKTNPFFEIPLSPSLLESEDKKWLPDYHLRSKTLVEYLLQYGAQSNARYVTISCLSELRIFLLQKNIPYTADNAKMWFYSTAKHPKGYRITLSRLEDLYRFGEIQPTNAFPHALCYEKNLIDPWHSILTDFKSSLSLDGNLNEEMKTCISAFLYKIQESGICAPTGITFDILEEYFQKNEYMSKRSFSRHAYAVRNIMLYMADKGMCSHGLGWYAHFRMRNHVFRIIDFTEEQVSILDATRTEKSVLSADEYAGLVPTFLNSFKTLGYSKSQCTSASYTLYNLLLFMEMHNLGYSKTVADIWLEHEKNYHRSDKWKTSRRILNLFLVYIDKKMIIPEMFFTEKALLYENLPMWCREELDSYLALKIKEGWEESTVVMIRSCVTRFCLFLTEQGIGSFSEIVPETLKDFNICDSHSSAEGKNAYNNRIRKFLQHLERKSVLPYGTHMALSAKAATSEKVVVVLTDDEKAEMNRKLSNCGSSRDLRDKVMMLIGTKMGLRASDIVTIRLTDIDWEKQTIRVMQEKTEQEILLPMPTEVGNAIYEYIRLGRPNEKTSEKYLLVKNRAPYNSLHRLACLRALKRVLPNRKIPGSGFHVTRKTFATDNLRNGAGKQMVADLLGHKGTHSLNHYLLLDEDRMRMCPLSLAETGLMMEDNRYVKV